VLLFLGENFCNIGFVVLFAEILSFNVEGVSITMYKRLHANQKAFFDLGSWLIVILTGWFLLFLMCLLFLWWVDFFAWYAPLTSQLIIAGLCTVLAYMHMKNAQKYREKYGECAYRYFFFRFIVPIFATGYALEIHPLLIKGEPLLPLWAALVMGVFLLLFRPLTLIHIKRAGFDNIGHGFGIYTIYPEEGPRIFSEIYSYIRHPMYLGSFCVALGFAFLRNSVIALATAFIFLVPILVEIRLEDHELIIRGGDNHRNYILSTGALFPRDIRGFFKLLFLGKGR
jgi:hypothetical protein